MAKSVKEKLYSSLKDSGVVTIGLDSKTPYFINSGHYALNMALSGRWLGGWGSGMVAEVFGESSTGKSLLTQRAMISMQRKEVYPVDGCDVDLTDTFILLDDTEKRYNEGFCAQQGMDINDVMKFKQTVTVESHFSQMEAMVEKVRKVAPTSPLMVLCDSISQLSTDQEMENGMDKVDLQKAKKIHQAMRIYSDFISSNSFLYLAASHVISGMSMYGPKRIVKGGGGLTFQSNTRLDLKYIRKFIRNEMETSEAGRRGEVFGTKIVAETVKNSVIAPFKFAILDIYFDYGIDPYSGMLDYFLRQGRAVQVKAKKKDDDDADAAEDKVGKNDKKKKKDPNSLMYSLDGKFEFLGKDLPDLIIAEDILGVKAAGFEYMKPISQMAEQLVEVDFEEGTDMAVPPPPVQ